MKRFFFRLICIALLLAGQQAALTHALAHAHDRNARAAVLHADGTPGGAEKSTGERFALCDFDYAYTQVLGALHSSCMPPLKVGASFDTTRPAGASRADTTEPPFLIRGPPHFL